MGAQHELHDRGRREMKRGAGRLLPSKQQRLFIKENVMAVDTILHNAKIATNRVPSFVEAIATTAGKISAVGTNEEVLRLGGPETKVIDGNRRTVIPGLNDFGCGWNVTETKSAGRSRRTANSGPRWEKRR